MQTLLTHSNYLIKKIKIQYHVASDFFINFKQFGLQCPTTMPNLKYSTPQGEPFSLLYCLSKHTIFLL